MTAATDASEYNITTRKVVLHGETYFEARVRELPDVCEYGETVVDAHDLAVDTIETAMEMFSEAGRPFPPPAVPQDDFSGRITLRLPKQMHRELAGSAQDEGISLNQHLVGMIAQAIGFAEGTRAARSSFLAGLRSARL